MNMNVSDTPTSGPSQPTSDSIKQATATTPLTGNGHVYSNGTSSSLIIVERKMIAPAETALEHLSHTYEMKQDIEIPEGKISKPENPEELEDCFFSSDENTTNPFEQLDQKQEKTIEKEQRAAFKEISGKSAEQTALAEQNKTASDVGNTLFNGLIDFAKKHQIDEECLQDIPKELQRIVSELVRMDTKSLPDPDKLFAKMEEILNRKQKNGEITQNKIPMPTDKFNAFMKDYKENFKEFYRTTILPYFVRRTQNTETKMKTEETHILPEKAPPQAKLPEIKFVAKHTVADDDLQQTARFKPLIRSFVQNSALTKYYSDAREKKRLDQELETILCVILKEIKDFYIQREAIKQGDLKCSITMLENHQRAMQIQVSA